MLNRQVSPLAPAPVFEEVGGELEFGLRDLFAFLRRRRTSIALVALAVVFLGGVYLKLTPSEYAATASLVISTPKIQIFGQGDVSSEASVTNSSTETEIQILGSTKIAEAVVRKLALVDDPEFMNPPSSPIGAAVRGLVRTIAGLLPQGDGKSAAPPPAPPTEDAKILRAVNLLKRDLVIRRAGLSYAINIVFFSSDPVMAARIANAVADAYVADQIDRQVSAAQRLSEWLAVRIEQLREQAYEDSDLTAQEKSARRLTYESFVQRYTQAVQQQSLPESQTLVITKAEVPTSRTSPKTSIVLAASLLLGSALGVGIAIARELLDRRLRTQEKLEGLTQSPSLGVLPTFKLRRRNRRNRPVGGLVLAEGAQRVFSAPQQFKVAQNAPFSLFAETLRRIKVASDFGPAGPVVVLGVISSVPNEGKTTVAANLAHQIGTMVPNVLLIDGDFRNPSLSLTLTPEDCPGLVQVLSNEVKLDDALWSDQGSGLRFLPTGGEPLGANSSELFGSNRMRSLVSELRKRFDFVIVDLPPVLTLVDARAADHILDGYVFVVEWGVTTSDLVVQGLRSAAIQPKLVGAVFNKVDLSRFRKFDPTSAARGRNAYFESYREVS